MKKIPKINPFIGFVFVLLITTAVSFFAYQSLRARDNADDVAFNSSKVITQIDEVLLGLVDMETGLRGYLLTGNDQLLEHYYTGKRQYEAEMNQLNFLTKDSPSLMTRWNTIDTLEKQWDSKWAVQGIQIRQEVNAGKVSSDALSSHVIAERDETVMDSIRTQLDAGKQEVTDGLVRQIQVGQQANYQAYNVMLTGIVVSLLLGLISGSILNQSNIEKGKHIKLQHLLLEEREKERLQLARDLHDGPVQELIGLSFTVQQLLTQETAPDIQDHLKSMKTSLQAVVGELRASAMQLRSPTLAKFGLQKAIQADIETLQQANPQMNIHFNCEAGAASLPEHIQSTLFRVYQESVRNVIRHSAANDANICLKVNDGRVVVLSVQDDGAGFALPDDWLILAREGHFGLVGIRERVEAVGGTLEIRSKPREGTTIQVTIPFAAQQSAART